ncbi:redoxin domain-containing protein [Aliikangiella sp. G2MR2-5]|uniref:peroxiredoxin family protein n=1 Tax=Aliikangiella sp. G2MR2-5 TaxID=2788943 RepID=UPI0018ABEDF9
MKAPIVALLAFLLVVSSSHKAFADDDEPAEGQLAPNFKITQLDGTEFQLSDFRGKQSVYLVFWNTWCTYCMKKIPKLKAAQEALVDDIRIIAINTGLKDSVEKTLKFQQQWQVNYPLAFDHGKQITDLYGVWGTPTEFIIDINGVIRHRDGIPGKLEDHLAEWNLKTSNEIADKSLCDEAQKRC